MSAELQSRAAQLRALTDRLQRQDVRRIVLLAQRRNDRLRERLDRIGHGLLLAPSQRLTRAGTRLQALSPLAVLDRGYALVFDADGKVLRNAADAAVGDTITARLANGNLSATVKSSAEGQG